MSEERHPCRHCRERPATRPRGLCKRCYTRNAIRCRYRCVKPQVGNRGLGFAAPTKPAREPMRTQDQEQRAEVMARRLAEGRHIYHPRDTRFGEDTDMEQLPIDAGGWVRCRDCGQPQTGYIWRRDDGHLCCDGCAGRRRDAEAHVQAMYDRERDSAGCGPVG